MDLPFVDKLEASSVANFCTSSLSSEVVVGTLAALTPAEVSSAGTLAAILGGSADDKFKVYILNIALQCTIPVMSYLVDIIA